MPSRPSEPRMSWRRSGPAADAGYGGVDTETDSEGVATQDEITGLEDAGVPAEEAAVHIDETAADFAADEIASGVDITEADEDADVRAEVRAELEEEAAETAREE